MDQKLPMSCIFIPKPRKNIMTNEISSEFWGFPYQPYKIQHEFMLKLHECIDTSSIGIFESPTGTVCSFVVLDDVLKYGLV